MASFLMFYAPFIVVILGVVAAFWWAPRDYHTVRKEGKSRE
ncbi:MULTISPECIES: cytochrome bd oxidase small subunit CydS [Lysinibacillus]